MLCQSSITPEFLVFLDEVLAIIVTVAIACSVSNVRHDVSRIHLSVTGSSSRCRFSKLLFDQASVSSCLIGA